MQSARPPPYRDTHRCKHLPFDHIVLHAQILSSEGLVGRHRPSPIKAREEICVLPVALRDAIPVLIEVLC